MSQLSEYLDLIENEKNTKLLPKNIIRGITILGVPGNSDFSVKVDASIETNRTGIQNYISEINKLDLTLIPTTSLASFFGSLYGLTKVSFKNTNKITDMNNLFYNGNSLKNIDFSEVNTSKVTNMQQMFYNCSVLEYIPVLNTSKVTNFSNMFGLCPMLSDESLNNILQMCINATSYSGTKKLSTLGFSSSSYTSSRIQSLSNYQSFINAGWTIGY